MKVIFASGRDFFPDRVDGAILSVHTLLRSLVQRGHACEALAGINAWHWPRGWIYRARRLLSRRRVMAWPDSNNGYPAYRAWETLLVPLLRERIERFRPDLVLTQLESSETLAGAAVRAGIPVVLFVRDAEFVWHRGSITDNPLVLFLASSRFVSERVTAKLGREAPSLYPIVRAGDYRVAERIPRFITLVNPVREKGIEVALEVAAQLPHRRFLFVETWPLPPPARQALRRRVAVLPNVRLRRPTLDMRDVYRQTALLLAPSQWDEAFGRVLLEAQASGIPVVASRVGGIPEAMLSGGVLLDPSAPPDAWALEIERLLSDLAAYERAGEEARQNVARPEFDPEALVTRFLTLATEHLARCRARSGERTAAGDTA
jgi:glycosyltransferase involved in cell wall biosynthesis